MSFSFQESISDFFSLEDTGTFSLSDLLNYFVVFMGAQFSYLLTAILYFWPMIDRATGIYEQKINNARPSDGPWILLKKLPSWSQWQPLIRKCKTSQP